MLTPTGKEIKWSANDTWLEYVVSGAPWWAVGKNIKTLKDLSVDCVSFQSTGGSGRQLILYIYIIFLHWIINTYWEFLIKPNKKASHYRLKIEAGEQPLAELRDQCSYCPPSSQRRAVWTVQSHRIASNSLWEAQRKSLPSTDVAECMALGVMV